jgi:hypothetical protein
MPARATQREYADRLGIIRAISVYAWGTVDEAQQRLAHIRLTQQELRTIKSDLQLEMQHIRSDFTAQRAGKRAQLCPWNGLAPTGAPARAITPEGAEATRAF